MEAAIIALYIIPMWIVFLIKAVEVIVCIFRDSVWHVTRKVYFMVFASFTPGVNIFFAVNYLMVAWCKVKPYLTK